jgi:transcriptional regulator with XRE-family HTH domain
MKAWGGGFMKRKFRQPRWKGLLPRSSELLGALARLCDWKPTHSVKERTWRKFCRGEHIQGSTRRAILEEMVRSLVRKVGTLLNVKSDARSWEQATQELLNLILAHAVWWDLLCMQLQRALPAKPTAFTTTVALRLLIVELAMRLAGMVQLEGNTLRFPPDLAQRHQVEPHRLLLPFALREVLKSAHITRMELAEALDVTKEAVDQWLEAGTIIAPERVDDIAQVVAEKTGLDATALSMALRAVRQLSLAVMPMADVVGQEEVGRLFMSLFKLSAVAQTTLQEQTAGLDEGARRELLSQLITLGGESPLGPALRTAMMEKMPDEDWKLAIATPPGKWMEFLGDAATVETLWTRVSSFLQAQEFPYQEEQAELLHQRVLIPRDSPSNPLAALYALPPEERTQAYMVWLQLSFHSLAKRPLEPQVLQTVGMLAEIFGLMRQISKDEIKAQAEDYQWRCQGLFIVGCMDHLRKHMAAQELPQAELWTERLLKMVRSLPALPEDPAPEMQTLFDVLRRLKHTQEAHLPWVSRRTPRKKKKK